jgi:5-methylcytosine-specific restriction endonuclease McrA
MLHHGWEGYMDGYLKAVLDTAKRVIKKDWDMVFIVDGIEGAGKCLYEGTTLKSTTDYPNQRKKYLKDYNDGEEVDTLSWDFNNKELVKSKSTIKYSGEKELFEVSLLTSKKVVASAEHRFFALVGKEIVEKKVGELGVGDYLMINSSESYMQSNTRRHKHPGIKKTRDTKRLAFIISKNKQCERCGIQPAYWQRELQIHHIDGCRANNNDSNLSVLCTSCHFKIHKSMNRIYFEKIKGIESKGTLRCYDLETPIYHNFILDNGIISHNSCLAQQCAKYCDDTVSLDKICFTPQEFVKAINGAEKFTAVIYDEAYGGMSSRAAMTEVNRMLMSVLAEIRQKNLFVFIILPCFMELDKYASVWRSRGLVHVYTGDDFSRGRFAFWNAERKKKLYIAGKKFYSYKWPKPNFYGSFSNGYVVDEQEYRQKKLEALTYREKIRETKSDKKSDSPTLIKVRKQRDTLIFRLAHEGMTYKDIASVTSMDENTIRSILKAEQT